MALLSIDGSTSVTRLLICLMVSERSGKTTQKCDVKSTMMDQPDSTDDVLHSGISQRTVKTN